MTFRKLDSGRLLHELVVLRFGDSKIGCREGEAPVEPKPGRTAGCVRLSRNFAFPNPNRQRREGNATGTKRKPVIRRIRRHRSYPLEIVTLSTAQSHKQVTSKHLFIDDHFIEEMSGVNRRFHQPVKCEDNPVIRADQPWEKDAWQEGEELDVYRAGPVTVGSPTRGYRAIRAENGQPITQTDVAGKFRFDRVRLGEYVLTVEADEFAPTQRHLKVGPQPEALTFQLKPGRKVPGQVIDDTGQAVGGACVVLNKWHVHADEEGNFSWSVEAPFPEEVQIAASKRYHLFKKFTATLPLSQLGQDPIILQRTQ
jgi:hypothetical protein